IGEPKPREGTGLVSLCFRVGPPAIPLSTATIADLEIALERVAGCVDRELSVALDLAFFQLESQHISLGGALQVVLTRVAVGAGHLLAMLFELDGADRGAPFPVERARGVAGGAGRPELERYGGNQQKDVGNLWEGRRGNSKIAPYRLRVSHGFVPLQGGEERVERNICPGRGTPHRTKGSGAPTDSCRHEERRILTP